MTLTKDRRNDIVSYPYTVIWGQCFWGLVENKKCIIETVGEKQIKCSFLFSLGDTGAFVKADSRACFVPGCLSYPTFSTNTRSSDSWRKSREQMGALKRATVVGQDGPVVDWRVGVSGDVVILYGGDTESVPHNTEFHIRIFKNAGDSGGYVQFDRVTWEIRTLGASSWKILDFSLCDYRQRTEGFTELGWIELLSAETVHTDTAESVSDEVGGGTIFGSVEMSAGERGEDLEGETDPAGTVSDDELEEAEPDSVVTDSGTAAADVNEISVEYDDGDEEVDVATTLEPEIESAVDATDDGETVIDSVHPVVAAVARNTLRLERARRSSLPEPSAWPASPERAMSEPSPFEMSSMLNPRSIGEVTRPGVETDLGRGLGRMDPVVSAVLPPPPPPRTPPPSVPSLPGGLPAFVAGPPVVRAAARVPPPPPLPDPRPRDPDTDITRRETGPVAPYVEPAPAAVGTTGSAPVVSKKVGVKINQVLASDLLRVAEAEPDDRGIVVISLASIKDVSWVVGKNTFVAKVEFTTSGMGLLSVPKVKLERDTSSSELDRFIVRFFEKDRGDVSVFFGGAGWADLDPASFIPNEIGETTDTIRQRKSAVKGDRRSERMNATGSAPAGGTGGQKEDEEVDGRTIPLRPEGFPKFDRPSWVRMTVIAALVTALVVLLGERAWYWQILVGAVTFAIVFAAQFVAAQVNSFVYGFMQDAAKTDANADFVRGYGGFMQKLDRLGGGVGTVGKWVGIFLGCLLAVFLVFTIFFAIGDATNYNRWLARQWDGVWHNCGDGQEWRDKCVIVNVQEVVSDAPKAVPIVVPEKVQPAAEQAAPPPQPAAAAQAPASEPPVTILTDADQTQIQLCAGRGDGWGKCCEDNFPAGPKREACLTR